MSLIKLPSVFSFFVYENCVTTFPLTLYHCLNKFTFQSKPSLNDDCKGETSTELNFTDDLHYVEIRNSGIINISIKSRRYN